MVNYKQIAVIKGSAAKAMKKAHDEERSYSFQYVKERDDETILIVSAEIVWHEEED